MGDATEKAEAKRTQEKAIARMRMNAALTGGVHIGWLLQLLQTRWSLTCELEARVGRDWRSLWLAMVGPGWAVAPSGPELANQPLSVVAAESG